MCVSLILILCYICSINAFKKLLIVQNKGGGHGELGYQLLNEFQKMGNSASVTLLQDDSCDINKTPFNSYTEFDSNDNINIIKAPLSSHSLDSIKMEQGFTHIIDNWSKKPEDFDFIKQNIIDSENNQIDRYLFVSSAGMYVQGKGLHAHTETDTVKEKNGARTVELAIEESSLSYTFIRPQYIYGPKANKRYLDYFIARAARKLPIPLPLHGEQLVCVSHVEDVCSMIATAIDHKNAKNQIFNCATDRFITYQGLSDKINELVGNNKDENKYMYYEPKDYNFHKGSAFPFRRDTFVVSVDKAKVQLDWKPVHDLIEDLKILCQNHIEGEGIKENWSKDQLNCDLEIIASKDINFTFTYPFFDDPKINLETMPYDFQSAGISAEK